jgi:hypothetical protein
MKKRSHHEQIDRNDRSSTGRERHMIAKRTSEMQIPEQAPESVAEAYRRVESLVMRGGITPLEELQGAVEYLLDRVKAARRLNG